MQLVMQEKNLCDEDVIVMLVAEIKSLRQEVAGLRRELRPELRKTATIQRVKQKEAVLSSAITRFLTAD